MLLFSVIGTVALAQDLADAGADAVPLRDTPTTLRPVQAALQIAVETWKLRLCYEDGPLASGWAPALGVGAAGANPASRRTLILSDVEKASEETVAAAIFEKSEAQNPLVRFSLRDVGGCSTATPVERLSSDSTTWEPVVPVLDRMIDMAPTTTYRGAIAEFKTAMNKTGIELLLNNLGGPSKNAQCTPASGVRVARDVLADILRCSPSSTDIFTLLSVDGMRWGLTLSHVTPPQWPPSQ